MARGRSSRSKASLLRVASTPRVSDSEEMNSMDTSPAPPQPRMIRRKALSVIPAIGARIRGGSTETGPIRSMEGRVSGSRLARGHGAPAPQPLDDLRSHGLLSRPDLPSDRAAAREDRSAGGHARPHDDDPVR